MDLHAQSRRQRGDFLIIYPDIARRAGATIAALRALEAKAVLEPGSLRHESESVITSASDFFDSRGGGFDVQGRIKSPRAKSDCSTALERSQRRVQAPCTV